MNVYKQDFEKHKENLEIGIVKEANHIFSFRKWQEDMLAKLCSWLEKNY